MYTKSNIFFLPIIKKIKTASFDNIKQQSNRVCVFVISKCKMYIKKYCQIHKWANTLLIGLSKIDLLGRFYLFGVWVFFKANVIKFFLLSLYNMNMIFKQTYHNDVAIRKEFNLLSEYTLENDWSWNLNTTYSNLNDLTFMKCSSTNRYMYSTWPKSHIWI